MLFIPVNRWLSIYLFFTCLAAARAEEPFTTETATQQSNTLGQKMFETKEFTGFGGRTSSLEGKTFVLPGTSSFQNQTASGFSKELNLPQANFNRDIPLKVFRLEDKLSLRTDAEPFSTATRSSLAGQETAPGFDKTFATKEYTGPEAEKMRRDVQAITEGLSKIKDIPDRTLSIQEVKELLNKDTRPARPVPQVLKEAN
jgi:hypothetical protein